MARVALRGKEILLGVSGGIACYKAVELVRELTKAGARVQVVMTRNAQEFVAPLTFEALSGRAVASDLFALGAEAAMAHIELARAADILAIVPATANLIGKMAGGIADDLLTTLLLAMRGPILVAPAMNSVMYSQPVVQNNLRKLKELACTIVEPEEGELACGEEGFGRLASLEIILDEMETLLAEKDFMGQRVLISAGPTYEPIDAVRFITNRSSGMMGYALAKAAWRRGARVSLISGPSLLTVPIAIELIRVETASQMQEEILSRWEEANVLIMAAAVTDFRPAMPVAHKVKRAAFPQAVALVANPDILKEAGEKKGNRILVGFAAETEALVENAMRKLKEKNLDLIVANDITQPDSGFGVPTNRVKLITADLKLKDFPLLPKEEVAEIVLNQIKEIRRLKGSPPGSFR